MTMIVREVLPARVAPAATAATPADLPGRLERIGFACAIAYLVFLAGSALQGWWLIDQAGRPIANDFVNVWAAGRLALAGQAASAYDWTIHKAAENAAVGWAFDGYYNWNYPPTFLLPAALLALIPFLPAALTWLALTLPAYVATIRMIVGQRAGILLACGFPAVLWNLSAGQNGFLTAALLGGTLACIERRPLAAGCLLGLLTYKPHFGILFPLVLVVDGRWRVIAAAALMALALAVVSWLAFGVDIWRAFLDSVLVTGNVVFAEGRAGLEKLQSLLGLVRWLGGGLTLAWVLHGALMAACAAAVAWLWRARVCFDIKAAALAAAALLATPYLYIYDFTVLAVAVAFLLRMGLRDGFQSGEFAALAAACLLILAFPFANVPTGFFAVVVVALLIGRRAVRELRSVLAPAV
jgi:arabinofuranan 3-O-arabinosyltransferase